MLGANGTRETEASPFTLARANGASDANDLHGTVLLKYE
jgi:hypothetical protein